MEARRRDERQRRENRGAVGAEGGEEWGEGNGGCPPPNRLGGLGSVVSSPSGGIWCILWPLEGR